MAETSSILVVEDDREIGRLLLATLSAAGCELLRLSDKCSGWRVMLSGAKNLSPRQILRFAQDDRRYA